MRDKMKSGLTLAMAVIMTVLSIGIISVSAEEDLLDGVPLVPAEREKKVVHISTLGELLSYTYDFYNSSYGVSYVQNKFGAVKKTP